VRGEKLPSETLAMEFDDATRMLRYVNAGQNPPLILRRDGSIHWLETSGAPVGMFPDWT